MPEYDYTVIILWPVEICLPRGLINDPLVQLSGHWAASVWPL